MRNLYIEPCAAENKTFQKICFHCKLRDCIAMPNGSVTVDFMGASSPITVPDRKNTSGLVQVAMARLICVVKNDSPT